MVRSSVPVREAPLMAAAVAVFGAVRDCRPEFVAGTAGVLSVRRARAAGAAVAGKGGDPLPDDVAAFVSPNRRAGGSRRCGRPGVAARSAGHSCWSPTRSRSRTGGGQRPGHRLHPGRRFGTSSLPEADDVGCRRSGAARGPDGRNLLGSNIFNSLIGGAG